MLTSADDVLDTAALECGYGRLRVIRGVNLTLKRGGAVAVAGPNGVGKSTVMRTIAGLLRPISGEIRFHGVPVGRSSAAHAARLGVSLVPEGRALFPGLTAEENLIIGGSAARGTRAPMPLARIYEIFPSLFELRRRRARQLSGGQQQLLAIARALRASPSVLLLDEPSVGLSPRATSEVLDVLNALKSDGLALLVAEQSSRVIADIADRALIFRNGAVEAELVGEEMRNLDTMRDLYL